MGRILLEKKRVMTAAAAPPASDIEETDHHNATCGGASIVVRTYRWTGKSPGPVLVVPHVGAECLVIWL